MSDGIKVTHVKEIITEISRLGEELAGPAMRDGLKSGAFWIRELARANLSQHVDTGRLWDALHVEGRIDKQRRRVAATLSTTPDTYYGWFLEAGTVHMQGVHWMQRAAESGGNKVIDEVKVSLALSLLKLRRVS